jgi:hypothetical protein
MFVDDHRKHCFYFPKAPRVRSTFPALADTGHIRYWSAWIGEHDLQHRTPLRTRDRVPLYPSKALVSQPRESTTDPL